MTRRYKIILTLILATAYLPLFAEPQNIATDLRIDWSKALPDEATLNDITNWNTACRSFAKKLTGGRGPNGIGPFTNVTCVELGKTAVKTMLAKNAYLPGWTLSLDKVADEDLWQLRLTHGTDSVTATIDLDAAVPVHEILSQPRLTDMLAMYLAESMPFRSVVDLSKLKQKPVLVATKSTGSPRCAKAPRDIVLYTLEHDGVLWRPNVLATSVKTRTHSSGKSLQYQFDAAEIKAIGDKTKVIFAHADDPKQNLETLKQCIVRDIRKHNEKWYALASSAYVGLRYGVPLIKSDVITSRAPLVGVFGEFRSGILDGLKLHYDWAPRQIKTDALGEASYEFSRVSAGLSFDTPIELGIFNFVDLTPKLGVTNLKLSFAPAPGSEEVGYELRQHRAPTIGLEAGAERRHSFGLYRLWSYFSYSVGVIPIDKNYSTKAVRTGLDGFFNLIDLGPMHLGALVFGVFDYTSIATKNPEGETPDGLVTTHGYLGSGLTLNW